MCLVVVVVGGGGGCQDNGARICAYVHACVMGMAPPEGGGGGGKVGRGIPPGVEQGLEARGHIWV